MSGSGIIYKTTNLVNGKIYVGIHTLGNDNYLGSGTILKLAIEKYSKSNFSRDVIDEFDSIDIGIAKEIYWIRELNSKSPNGYNLNDGGRGSLRPSEETRRRLRESHMGIPKTPETIEKLRLANTGRHPSEEARKKMSLARRGWKPSEETKGKISIAKKGTVPSEEAKEKMRKSQQKRRDAERANQG